MQSGDPDRQWWRRFTATAAGSAVGRVLAEWTKKVLEEAGLM